MASTIKEIYAFLKEIAKMAISGMAQIVRAKLEWLSIQSPMPAHIAIPQIGQYQTANVAVHLLTTPQAQAAAPAFLTASITQQHKPASASPTIP